MCCVCIFCARVSRTFAILARPGARESPFPRYHMPARMGLWPRACTRRVQYIIRGKRTTFILHAGVYRRGIRSPFIGMQQQLPGVKAPAGFQQPQPKPLQATGDWLGLLTASLALGLRFGAGITVTGWYVCWHTNLFIYVPSAWVYFCPRGRTPLRI